jgi:hypothetical protein
VGSVGGSKVAIHPVVLSSGTPAVKAIMPSSCSLSICTSSIAYCSYCDSQRLAVDEYAVQSTGLWNVQIHVIDGLASAEAPATTASVAALDASNTGVIGAAVLRSGRQSYVVASSAQAGASSSSMTYRTPGGAAARHVVFDAPEDATGHSKVTAASSGGSCVVTITAGAGAMGRPLMFTVGTAASSCTITPLTDAPADSP